MLGEPMEFRKFPMKRANTCCYCGKHLPIDTPAYGQKIDMKHWRFLCVECFARHVHTKSGSFGHAEIGRQETAPPDEEIMLASEPIKIEADFLSGIRDTAKWRF